VVPFRPPVRRLVPAAAELNLHRSTLFNRVNRIQEVAGVNLQSGSDRLELHLGIRLWRMSGAPRGPAP
jgi:DNA-binding PucR family transcriptional regulator